MCLAVLLKFTSVASINNVDNTWICRVVLGIDGLHFIGFVQLLIVDNRLFILV